MRPDDPGENDSSVLVEHHRRICFHNDGCLLTRQSAVAPAYVNPTRLGCSFARRRSSGAATRASCRPRRLTVLSRGHYRDVALSTFARTRCHAGECAPSSSAVSSARTSAARDFSEVSEARKYPSSAARVVAHLMPVSMRNRCPRKGPRSCPRKGPRKHPRRRLAAHSESRKFF